MSLTINKQLFISILEHNIVVFTSQQCTHLTINYTTVFTRSDTDSTLFITNTIVAIVNSTACKFHGCMTKTHSINEYREPSV